MHISGATTASPSKMVSQRPRLLTA
ncbi:hypothetical protein IEO21_04861 [Rhodonia placenta]|uniref:Uncharacterized protein n=1 Tax=Rhodonia placenta TaxID=104341 RepID=A0A8H7P321_9APHY|nr:hypothetical protein IEO21_04861 [Postia placenta]